MGARETARGGDDAADREHRTLLALIDRYAAAAASRAPQEHLIGIAERLIAAAREHVDHEEAEMQRAAYPQAPQHFAAHRHLLSTVANLLYSLRGARPPPEPAMSLQHWLAAHLAGDDSAFYAWLDGAARRG